jgi:phosphoglucomutase
MTNYKKAYGTWLAKAVEDKDLVEELKAISDDDVKIEDAFYRDLAFGL